MFKRTSMCAAAVLLAVFAVQAFAEGLPDFTELVERNSPSVVKITTTTEVTQTRSSGQQQEVPEIFRYFFGDQLPDNFNYQPNPRPRQGLGSGFILSEDGYILTNNHVVDHTDEVTVTLTDGTEYAAELIGTDPQSDVALLKIDGENLHAVEIGSSEELKVGEWVLAIGSPFNFDYSVTAGIVSAKGRALGGADRYVPFIQTDVAINPGNSGGPLFNLDGEVVGINSQIYTRSGGFMGVSFAIPIDIAMDIADQLKETGTVERGWLGVEMYPPFNENPELAQSMGLDRAEGALVARVFDNSPAADGGIRTDDIILSFNDHPVRRYSDLPPLVGQVRPGTTVEVEVLRGGERRTLDVTIGVLNEQELAAGNPQQPTSDNPLNIIVADVDGGDGVRVERVLAGPALEAGLRDGDIITMLGGEFINDKEEFDRLVTQLPDNGAVAVRVLRGDNIVYLAIPTD
ncbi:DegQ family serine endoprotease [Saccharospirillum sp. HFRX-1]|uniref:DegQ family serine endoprotease n=1 Tax=unclassified Saccharospirillum TaxID=2633430 RepID=UPI00371C3821